MRGATSRKIVTMLRGTGAREVLMRISDSLAFLSEKGLYAFTGGDGFCDACFTGRYPSRCPTTPKPGSSCCSRCAIRRLKRDA